MKKLLLAFGLIISSLHAYSQNGYSSVFLRVTDSATFVNSANTTAKHAANYADIWYSTASGLFWKWSTVTNTYTMISEGGNFWKNAGTTNLTGDVDIVGAFNVQFNNAYFGAEADTDIHLWTSVTGANIYMGPTVGSGINGVSVNGNAIELVTVGNSAALQLGNSASLAANDDILISAGSAGTSHDINMVSLYGHTHITTGAAGILLDPAGPITVNTDPGAVDEVLTSTGPTTAPIWKAVSGGGGVNAFAPNIQTGNYTAVIGDTITVIYMRNVSTPQTLTIPLNVFPVGSFITVVQDTTAVTTVAGASGVDIIGRLTLKQKESAVFHQRSSNTWVRIGGGETVWTAWTPTFTGFSVNPVVEAAYIVDGKKVTVYMNNITLGTSNATTFTVTNLPYPPKSNTFRLAYITNNSNVSVGRFFILAGDTIVTFNATPAAGAFTASGGKGANLELTYEIN